MYTDFVQGARQMIEMGVPSSDILGVNGRDASGQSTSTVKLQPQCVLSISAIDNFGY
jgi:hypothetical protein